MFDSIVLRESGRPQPGPGEVGAESPLQPELLTCFRPGTAPRPAEGPRSITEIGMECVGNVWVVGSDVTHWVGSATT
jgi:hypothetical protein